MCSLFHLQNQKSNFSLKISLFNSDKYVVHTNGLLFYIFQYWFFVLYSRDVIGR